MRNWTIAFVGIMLVVGGGLVASGRGTTQQSPPGIELLNGKPVAAGTVLVKFKSAPSAADKAALMTGEDLDQFRGIGGTGYVRLHSRSKSAAALFADLRALPSVLHVEPDAVFTITNTPNDLQSAQWDLLNTGQTIAGQAGTPGADIKATSAWDMTTGSRAITVGVVDTGIQTCHPDLANVDSNCQPLTNGFASNIWSAPAQFNVTIGTTEYTCPAGSHGFNAQNYTCGVHDADDWEGHGTAVAGTIGAVGNNGFGVVGVNWETSMMSLLACDRSGVCASSSVASAIEFAIQTKRHFGSAADMRVINMSFAGEVEDDALKSEMLRAAAYDILFVAGAGNDYVDIDNNPRWPASWALGNEIGVAGSDNRDDLALYSNPQHPASDWGFNGVQLAAPGWNGYTTAWNSGYGGFGGTSMAAPHVTGAAALVLSVCPLYYDGLKQEIVSHVDALGQWASLVGSGGRLNAAKAVSACTTGTSGAGSISIGGPTEREGSGTLTVTIGSESWSVGYDACCDTGEGLATSLAYEINSGPDQFVNASVPAGSSTILLAALAKGLVTNYSYSADAETTLCPDPSNPQTCGCDPNNDPYCPPKGPAFHASAAGAKFTGGGPS